MLLLSKVGELKETVQQWLGCRLSTHRELVSPVGKLAHARKVEMERWQMHVR